MNDRPGATRHPSKEGNKPRTKFPSLEGCPEGAGW